MTQNGLVTGRKSGIVTITAVTSNGLYSRFTLDINDPTQPRRIELDVDSAVTLDVGDTLQVTPVVIPETAAAKLTWKSSNKKVASVSKTGLITAKKKGTAKITVTTQNKVKAIITLTVIDTRTPTSVKLDKSGTVILNLQDTLQLTPTVYPETAVTTLTWTSGNRRVAAVSADGVVTPLKTGKAKITVKTGNRKSASVTVRVVDPTIATGVKLDRTGTVEVALGSTLQLTASALPETAVTTFRWSSASGKIATVSQEGLVTPIKLGKTKITVRTANGKKATVTVKVVEASRVPATPTDLEDIASPTDLGK